jgi:MFS family permease
MIQSKLNLNDEINDTINNNFSDNKIDNNNNIDEKEKKEKSLKYSIYDGAFYSGMVGFGESFFSAFAIFLNATNLHIGLIGSLPQTLGSLFQLFSRRVLKFFGSRKKMVLIGVFLQALMHIPIAFAFFLGELRIYYLIIFVCLYWIIGMFINPAWNSWMGDLVDPDNRGKYFGLRNKVAGIASFTFLISGFILQKTSIDINTQYIGFALIFGIAIILRVISFVFLLKKYEPKYEFSPKADFSFIEFLKHANHRNFGTFVLFLCSINFAVYISAPFFIAYMIKDLHFNYFLYSIVLVFAMLTKLVSMPLWGMLSDKYGTKKMLTIASFLIPFPPILWIFSIELWWILLLQGISGIIWAGFDITAFNFIYDSTKPYKRATCVSYYNALNGFFILSGSIIGALIVKYNHIFWSKYYLVFIISGFLRLIIAFYFIPRIKEVRKVEYVSYKNILMSIISIIPNRGFVYNFISMKKKNNKIENNKLDSEIDKINLK